MAKQQRRARSKGEKGWARRERERIQKKFADKWLVELEQQARASEVGKVTGGWDRTPARHSFEEVKRLQGAKERLQNETVEKIASELRQLQQLDEQLEKFGQRAGAGDSSEDESRQVVAAVRERGDVDEGGSSVGCAQVTGELQEQVAAAQRRASEAEYRLRQVADQREREEQEVERQEGGWRDQLSEARRRVDEAEARAEKAESEIAGWQVAGKFAKTKVAEEKEATKRAEQKAVKMVAAAQARW